MIRLSSKHKVESSVNTPGEKKDRLTLIKESQPSTEELGRTSVPEGLDNVYDVPLTMRVSPGHMVSVRSNSAKGKNPRLI